jgi:hypothetical protein
MGDVGAESVDKNGFRLPSEAVPQASLHSPEKGSARDHLEIVFKLVED